MKDPNRKKKKKRIELFKSTGWNQNKVFISN